VLFFKVIKYCSFTRKTYFDKSILVTGSNNAGGWGRSHQLPEALSIVVSSIIVFAVIIITAKAILELTTKLILSAFSYILRSATFLHKYTEFTISVLW